MPTPYQISLESMIDLSFYKMVTSTLATLYRSVERPILNHSFLYAYIMFGLIFPFSGSKVLFYPIMEEEVFKQFQFPELRNKEWVNLNSS